MLEMRRLGKRGPELSTVGFGAWAAGGPWKVGWGPQSDEDFYSRHPSLSGTGLQLDRHGGDLRAGSLGRGGRPGAARTGSRLRDCCDEVRPRAG